jgi:hypothetical protein
MRMNMNEKQHKLVIKAIAWLLDWRMVEHAEAINNLLVSYELLKLEAEERLSE